MYIAAGFICFGLGVAGALLPLLPTTPFLLLSAFFFARSSERWHEWLVTHRTFGPYIAAFREKRGLTAAQKRRIAIALTLTLLVTVWFSPFWWVRALVGVIWFFWMIVLFRSRTAAEAVIFEEAD
jgi:hypothetical protein